MIDVTHLRANPELYAEAARKKRVSFDVQAFLALDETYRALKTEVEQSRALQNQASKLLPTLKGDEKTQKLSEMKELSQSLKEKETLLKEKDEEWNRLLLRAPGIPLSEVPEGKDDSENVESHKWGEPPKFSFPIKDHIEIGKSLGIIDIERGVKISGTRNYFLKGDGAALHHAVLQASLQFLSKRGYTRVEPPHIVNYPAMMGTGYFPGGEEQAYQLDPRDPEKFLIGTSEVSVCASHMGEILSLDELPKRYAGYSPCYRREAGTYGKDTQGLYRIHQFYKVEQVVICKNDAEESSRFHAELLKNAEDFLQHLELPYRVVKVCTGDMGLGQVFKHDIECWMPSRNSYGETHSCSTFYEFQARRLNLRYRDETGKVVFCHTLNNTHIASPRVLIPLIENNQESDGRIKIPKALQPFMDGKTHLSAV